MKIKIERSEVTRLRNKGLSWRDVGARLGVGGSTIHKLYEGDERAQSFEIRPRRSKSKKQAQLKLVRQAPRSQDIESACRLLHETIAADPSIWSVTVSASGAVEVRRTKTERIEL